MFAQFVLPLQLENHPAFSQSKMKGIMTSLPPNSTCFYTAHVHSTTCILHIQHVNTMKYHYNTFIARGYQYNSKSTVDSSDVH